MKLIWLPISQKVTLDSIQQLIKTINIYKTFIKNIKYEKHKAQEKVFRGKLCRCVYNVYMCILTRISHITKKIPEVLFTIWDTLSLSHNIFIWPLNKP